MLGLLNQARMIIATETRKFIVQEYFLEDADEEHKAAFSRNEITIQDIRQRNVAKLLTWPGLGGVSKLFIDGASSGDEVSFQSGHRTVLTFYRNHFPLGIIAPSKRFQISCSRQPRLQPISFPKSSTFRSVYI